MDEISSFPPKGGSKTLCYTNLCSFSTTFSSASPYFASCELEISSYMYIVYAIRIDFWAQENQPRSPDHLLSMILKWWSKAGWGRENSCDPCGLHITFEAWITIYMKFAIHTTNKTILKCSVSTLTQLHRL